MSTVNVIFQNHYLYPLRTDYSTCFTSKDALSSYSGLSSPMILSRILSYLVCLKPWPSSWVISCAPHFQCNKKVLIQHMGIGKEFTSINSSSKTKGLIRTKMVSLQMCVCVYIPFLLMILSWLLFFWAHHYFLISATGITAVFNKECTGITIFKSLSKRSLQPMVWPLTSFMSAINTEINIQPSQNLYINMQQLAWWHSKGNELLCINRHRLVTLILTQELSRNGKELAGNVLEMGKKLTCTAAGQSWQHILLGAESLHGFERGLDEHLQKKSLQHHYGTPLLGKFFAGKPHCSSALPWVPTRALARGQLLLHPHLLLGVIPTSSLPLHGF